VTGVCLAMLAGLLAFVPASANDSTASLDAGGLRLMSNPDIRMESEDLYISREQVRVVYRFHNTSARDISTLVAFPLPAMEIGEGGNYALRGSDPVNVIDFQVAVDGRGVEPSVEVKALRFGVDVTEVLRRHGIPPTMRTGTQGADEALYKQLADMPADARSELERYGVIDWTTTFGADGKPYANVHWDTHITFYWFQTFPAGRTIEVTHRYHPVPRHFFFVAEEIGSAERQKAYCLDADFQRGARARMQASKQTVMLGFELKYVLMTAGNWLGPIQRFQLTVEKTKADSLVSLCAKGLRRASPTAFVMSRENYTPEDDLRILFLEPAEASK
jgi:hypothetical protein